MSAFHTRLDTLARRVQSIISTATGEDAPITAQEAYGQIIEEMELAGFGAPKLAGDFTADDIAALRGGALH